uniref:Ig-like domain-containing protein n=1 Tax=Sus scrofa TaxID=9823 RepID=A0A4X1SII3_PIG
RETRFSSYNFPVASLCFPETQDPRGSHPFLEGRAAGSSPVTGPKAVRGQERGSLAVQCRYTPGWESHGKWWCRGADWGNCKILVQTTASEPEVKRDRVSIRDDRENRTFTVTTEELRLDDAGIYWCGIARVGTDHAEQVSVTVDPGSSPVTGPKAVRGQERGSLAVQCRYTPGWESHGKWWCRGADWGNCKILVQTTASEPEVKRDRVSIRDDRENRTFTVTTEELRLDDAGIYWCGIARVGTDHAEQVSVTVDPGSSPVTGPKAVRGQERGSLAVQCRYTPGWESHGKWWCRGADWDSCKILVQTTASEPEVKRDRVSIRDDRENRTFTVTTEELRLDDAGVYWCGIERVGHDHGTQVRVTVDPAPVTSGDDSLNMTSHGPNGRSLLRSIHFLLLVFLKMPLFLGMLSAVLWVHRPQGSSRWETKSAL